MGRKRVVMRRGKPGSLETPTQTCCLQTMLAVGLPLLLLSSVVIIIIFNIQFVRHFNAYNKRQSNVAFMADDRIVHNLPPLDELMLQLSNTTAVHHLRPVHIPEKSPLNIFKMNSPVKDKSNCVNLATLSCKICVHDIEKDKYISNTITLGRFWESDAVFQLWSIFSNDPDMHLIDLGANIGQFTLLAAYAGRHVVAVEPRWKHIQMMHHSTVLNGYESRVTLIHNAISDRREKVYLGVYSDNQGGAHVVQSKQTSNISEVIVEDNVVETILLSDLVPVIPFYKAVIKMDIEGFEDKALKYADALLDEVYVPHIIMEWMSMKSKPRTVVVPILDWFEARGYESYDVGWDVQLNRINWRFWPTDVYWKKKTLE